MASGGDFVPLRGAEWRAVPLAFEGTAAAAVAHKQAKKRKKARRQLALRERHRHGINAALLPGKGGASAGAGAGAGGFGTKAAALAGVEDGGSAAADAARSDDAVNADGDRVALTVGAAHGAGLGVRFELPQRQSFDRLGREVQASVRPGGRPFPRVAAFVPVPVDGGGGGDAGMGPGPVAKCGRVGVGDWLVSVNGASTEDAARGAFLAALRARPARLLFEPPIGAREERARLAGRPRITLSVSDAAAAGVRAAGSDCGFYRLQAAVGFAGPLPPVPPPPLFRLAPDALRAKKRARKLARLARKQGSSASSV